MILLPLLTGLAFATFSLAQADPTESAEGWFLSITATGILAAAGMASRAAAGRPWAGRPWAGRPLTGRPLAAAATRRWPVCIAFLVLTAFYFLHQGPQRGGVVLALLVLGFLGSLALSWPKLEARALEARALETRALETRDLEGDRFHVPWRAALPWSLAAAFGVEFAVSPDAVLRLAGALRVMLTGVEGAAGQVSPNLGGALVEVLVWPALAGLSVAVLGVCLGRLGLLLGAGHLILTPGSDPHAVGLLGSGAVLAAAILWWLDRRPDRQRSRHGAAAQAGLRLGPRIRRWLQAYALLLLLLALPVLLAAAYPWQRADPWGVLPELLTPPRTARVVLGHGPLVLSHEEPLYRVELGAQEPAESSVPVRALVVGSALVHGADLSGETVAYIRVFDAAGEMIVRLPIVAGIHTADWAAGRADVASREDFESPAPWAYSVAPSGRFFAQRFRTVFARDAQYLSKNGPDRAAALEIVRRPSLPRETRLHLYRWEIR